MPDPRTQIVADGYDAMGEAFAAWREEAVGDPRREWEDELVFRLDEGARLLVREPGFTIERDEVAAWEAPDGPERFQWVLAQA